MNNECEKMKNQIADYISGILPDTEAVNLQRHLSKCQICSEYARALKDEDELLTALFADIDTDMEARQERVLQTINHSDRLRQTKTISIWRVIMNSKITKYAAAAVIIAVAYLIIYFSGGSVSLSTIAFADMTEAMKTEPWVHIKSSGQSAGTTGPNEMWVSFESKICAAKMVNGQLSFMNLNEHKSYTYDPNSRSITIDYVYENDFPEYFSSPVSIVESMIQQLEAQGAQIITSQAEYNGKQVQLQETVLSVENSSYSVRLYIQPDTKLLLAEHVELTDAEGNTNMLGEMIFNYPQTGPTDIYALGVPRDAAIIDKLPGADFMAVWDIYRRIREEAIKVYIAVITHSSEPLGDVINMVDVDYKSGENQRWERHFVFKTGQNIDISWPQYKLQLGESFDSLLAWTQAHYKDSGRISAYLYDGQYHYSTTRDDNNWSAISNSYSPDNAMMPNETLGDISRPIIGKKGHIIEDDYAKENNLICIERLQQGSIYRDIVSLPGRFLYYLDPQKDYLCVRKVTEWRPDADWQEDKDWLDEIEPEKVRDGSITVEDITETIQASNRHWYPQTIEEKQTGIRKDYKESPLRLRRTKKIYIRISPEFPDDIFDTGIFPVR